MKWIQTLSYSSWKWPVLIVASILGVALVTFVDTVHPNIRILVASWFLLVCPGMALIRLLRLDDTLTVWMLAIALSLALDAIVAGVMLYTSRWSIQLGIGALMLITLLGLALQIRQQKV